jgi:uncharacterized sulfatase
MQRSVKQLIVGTLWSISMGLVACSSGDIQQDAKRPNIIFIMSDDHAYQAISAYGYPIGKVAPTPNIDRLANEGIRFENSFVTNSICGPSRAVMLTGKHSHLNGYLHNSGGKGFDGSQPTLPKYLQQAGYQTALVGKWHLGTTPTGFDHWDILIDQGEYYNPDFVKNGDTTLIEGYATDLITSKALDWLKNDRDNETPFCLILQHKAPHRNWMPPIRHINTYDSVQFPVPETYFDGYEGRQAAGEQEMNIYRDMYEGHDLKMTVAKGSDSLRYNRWPHLFDRMTAEQKEQWNNAYRPKNDDFHDQNLSGKAEALWKLQRYLSDYMGTIAAVDEGIGEVLDYLKAAGLEENTIVVYTSDQGFYLGEHGWFDKRFMYEESFKTPLLIRYPEKIKPGSVSTELVQNLDFAPTFLHYAEVPIPEDMQGESLHPILENESVDDWRTALYYHYYEYPAFHMVKRHYGIRTPQHKLIHFYNDIDAWEFYDLEKDPHETRNLIDDPNYASLVDSLKSELHNLEDYYKVPPASEWKDMPLRGAR